MFITIIYSNINQLEKPKNVKYEIETLDCIYEVLEF